MQQPPNIPQAVQVWLAEFDALRREIQTRTTFQQAIVGFNLIATGTILSLALSQKENRDLGVLLAFLSPVLGFYWLDHHFVIMELGRYIKERIQPALASLVGTQEILGFESYFAEKRTGRLWARLYFFAGILFTFPGAIGLGLSFHVLTRSGVIGTFLWILGLTFLGLWFADWISVMTADWRSVTSAKHRIE